MATFQIFNDDENAMVVHPAKLKDTTKSLQQRSALGEIANNKTENVKQIIQESKLVYPAVKAVKECEVKQKDDVKQASSKGKGLSERELIETSDTKTIEEPMSECSINLSPMVICTPTATSLACVKEKLDDLYECLDYRNDIYNYLRKLEFKYKPKPFYMKRQPDITYTMRTILVDWLVEVAEEYKLHNETLFMAVSYVDRFLSTMAVVRAKLQLLGAAAMFVSAKYEEIYPPDVGEFSYITDDTYSKKQILRMEHLILKTLGFNMSSPTIHTFLTHMAIVGQLEDEETILAMYISELTLLEGDPYLEYNPSIIACGAIALARHMLGYADVWPTSLVKISSYPISSLASIVSHLNVTHAKAATSQQAAIREKYKSKKFQYISKIRHKPLHLRQPNE